VATTPLAAAGGARAFASRDRPLRRGIIMSYPRKLVRALAVLASEPGDARGTSELACRADAAAAGLARRAETAGPQTATFAGGNRPVGNLLPETAAVAVDIIPVAEQGVVGVPPDMAC